MGSDFINISEIALAYKLEELLGRTLGVDFSIGKFPTNSENTMTMFSLNMPYKYDGDQGRALNSYMGKYQARSEDREETITLISDLVELLPQFGLLAIDPESGKSIKVRLIDQQGSISPIYSEEIQGKTFYIGNVTLQIKVVNELY